MYITIWILDFFGFSWQDFISHLQMFRLIKQTISLEFFFGQGTLYEKLIFNLFIY